MVAAQSQMPNITNLTCLILMQGLQHKHVLQVLWCAVHRTSLSLYLWMSTFFLLHLLSAFLRSVFYIGTAGNHCWISTTRQAAMLKHKCIRPVLNAQMLIHSFYQKFQSHSSVRAQWQSLLQCSCGMCQVICQVIKIVQRPRCTAQSHLFRRTVFETLDKGCAIPSFFANKHAHHNHSCQNSVLVTFCWENVRVFSHHTLLGVYSSYFHSTNVQALYPRNLFFALNSRPNGMKLVQIGCAHQRRLAA